MDFERVAHILERLCWGSVLRVSAVDIWVDKQVAWGSLCERKRPCALRGCPGAPCELAACALPSGEAACEGVQEWKAKE